MALPVDLAMEGAKDILFEIPGQMTCFRDGSWLRPSALPSIPPSLQFRHGVATKDVAIDEATGIAVRIFLPQVASSGRPLPLVLYAHGGAYCIGDPAAPPFHDFCHRISVKSRAIWISLRYRLAPEHRLPAAYDDGCRALKWLRSVANGASSEPWICEFGDLSRCFLAGESAGAALMFNVAMRLAEEEASSSSSIIKGLILVHPGFHTEAKRSAIVTEPIGTYSFYRFALPEGSDLDHPWVNPLSPQAPSLSLLSAYPRILLAAAENDLRYDLTLRIYDDLKVHCAEALLHISKGKGHAFHILDEYCEEAAGLEQEVAKFICCT